MTRLQEDLILSAIFWPVLLGFFFWYARRKKHPNRTSLNAFLIFTGIFLGIALTTFLVVAATLAHALGGTESAAGIAGIIVLVVAVLAWRLARSKIQKDPTLSEVKKPPPDSHSQQ